jgi:membrane-associated protease RseP (regulator of RpoE activity)
LIGKHAVVKTILSLVAGLFAGVAVAVFWPSADQEFRFTAADEQPGLTERVAELERALARETTGRRALERELETLRANLIELQVAGEFDVEPPQADVPPETATLRRAELAEQIAERRGNGDGPLPLRTSRINQADRLVEAGFTPEQAAWIDERTEQLRVDAMQARYEAARAGEPFAGIDMDERLRAELGDADYERYLVATGRSTTVSVSGVLATSAAETAGLVAGDEIVAYGGQRVFDTRDLNAVLLEGEAGEPVIVDIRRDGQTLQLVLPRGPLGITSGGRGRFRR